MEKQILNDLLKLRTDILEIFSKYSEFIVDGNLKNTDGIENKLKSLEYQKNRLNKTYYGNTRDSYKKSSIIDAFKEIETKSDEINASLKNFLKTNQNKELEKTFLEKFNKISSSIPKSYCYVMEEEALVMDRWEESTYNWKTHRYIYENSIELNFDVPKTVNVEEIESFSKQLENLKLEKENEKKEKEDLVKLYDQRIAECNKMIENQKELRNLIDEYTKDANDLIAIYNSEIKNINNIKTELARKDYKNYQFILDKDDLLNSLGSDEKCNKMINKFLDLCRSGKNIDCYPFIESNKLKNFTYKDLFKYLLDDLIKHCKDKIQENELDKKSNIKKKHEAIKDIGDAEKQIDQYSKEKNALEREIKSNISFEDASELLNKYNKSKTEELSRF